MTRQWTISPIWKGETVAVLGSGPSMNQAVADSLRRFKCIAVNYTHQLAPSAAMMLALDANIPLWESAKRFAGIRVCGVQHNDIDALYAGPMGERVKIAPGHVVDVMNSGLAAIRLAHRLGAARIILAGFDPEQAGHFVGRPADGPPKQHVAVAHGLLAIVAELRAAGVLVEFHKLPTEIKRLAAPRRRGARNA